MKNVTIVGNILTALVLCELDENRAYEITVDMSTEWGTVIKSTFPEDERMYERQVIMALHERRGEELPSEFVSAWV